MKMNRQALQLVALFVLGFAVRLGTTWLLRQPGYTDAYYYAVAAKQLYLGQGLDEPIIWNYLDPPAQVVHPGFAYWMPLPALLGWLGLLVGGSSFQALRMPFVLLSAFLPVVSYVVAWDLTREERYAILAGLLAVFPGFFAVGFVLPETFATFAVAGGVCLWASGRGLQDGRPMWFALAGLAAGFAHLARADGLLLAGIGLLASAFAGACPGHGSPQQMESAQSILGEKRAQVPYQSIARMRSVVINVVLTAAGYFLIMGPWYLRNWLTFGTPLPGAGTTTLWLTIYDDMFAYNRSLTMENYIAWGWGPILKSKLDALLLNLQRVWVEVLMIVLLPLVVLGLWRLRRERLLWPFFVYAPLLFLAMTVAFTFPGARGGLYHSSSAWLPFVYAVTGPGLDVAVRWAARRIRGWYAQRAWRVFAAGLVALAALMTLLALLRSGVLSNEWNRRHWEYEAMSGWLEQNGAKEAIVMAGDPAAFAWLTSHLAIAVPNEPLETILMVADRYGARFLVLDKSRPRTTDALFRGQVTHPRLKLVLTVGEEEQPWQLYGIRDMDTP